MGEGMLLAAVGLILLRGWWKGADVYAAALRGGKRGMDAALGLLPALCAMTMLLALVEHSGLNNLLARLLSPVLRLLGLPGEVSALLVLRPLTGSGSLSALQQVFAQWGVDSRAGRAASVLMGSSETIFYTMTVYLAATDVRHLPWVLPVSLLSYLASAWLCGILV